MKKTVLMIMAGVAVLSACKKSGSNTTVQQKIVNKWGVESIVNNYYYSGSTQTNTTAGASGDYFDFRSNNMVYSKVGASLDTTTYSILNDQSVKIDVDTFQIKTLTDNSFVLYNKTVFSPTSYDETTLSLGK